jgi:predicted enzyme related to lactoylglutathione lyase
MECNQSNPVVWFEIYVQDMHRARAFYESVLQTSFTPMIDPTDSGLEILGFPSSVEDYGAPGALVKMEGAPSGFSGTLVYFKCDDCGVVAARAAASGGKIFKEKMSIGQHGFIALVYDTEGNMIGLHSMQ